MTTEENKRMLALSCTVADLKTENMYLAQRVRELVDEYNNVAYPNFIFIPTFGGFYSNKLIS